MLLSFWLHWLHWPPHDNYCCTCNTSCTTTCHICHMNYLHWNNYLLCEHVFCCAIICLWNPLVLPPLSWEQNQFPSASFTHIFCCFPNQEIRQRRRGVQVDPAETDLETFQVRNIQLSHRTCLLSVCHNSLNNFITNASPRQLRPTLGWLCAKAANHCLWINLNCQWKQCVALWQKALILIVFNHLF